MRVLQPSYKQLGKVDLFTAISSGAGTAASIAVAANAVPGVGQVLSAIALVSGLIAGARAKSNSIKEQSGQVDVANRDLIVLNAELDDSITKANQQINEVNTELTRMGLNGYQLNGFSDFLKKTFTPVRYQQGILDDKVAQNKQLQASAEQKIKSLEAIETELKRVYDKLTGGKTLQNVLLWGGGVAVGLTILYFLNEKFKWV